MVVAKVTRTLYTLDFYTCNFSILTTEKSKVTRAGRLHATLSLAKAKRAGWLHATLSLAKATRCGEERASAGRVVAA